jgi:hypothetical protein
VSAVCVPNHSNSRGGGIYLLYLLISSWVFVTRRCGHVAVILEVHAPSTKMDYDDVHDVSEVHYVPMTIYLSEICTSETTVTLPASTRCEDK